MTSERPDDVGWLKGGKGEDISLTEELKLFAEYIKLDRTEVETRELVVHNIIEYIQGVYPGAITNPFGSYPLGLSIYSSDLDLSVDNVNTVPPKENFHDKLNKAITRRHALNQLIRKRNGLYVYNYCGNVIPVAECDIKKEMEKAKKRVQRERRRLTKPPYIMKLTNAFGLNALADSFRKNPLVSNVKLLKGATVPIVKLSYRCGIHADISWNSSGGLVVKSMVERQGSALIDLSLFLKVYLNQLKLDEVFTGGLGSYRLYVMVSEHIARNPQFVEDPNNPDLGALLLSFFTYFSDPKLFHKKTVIQVPEAEPIKLHSSKLYETLREVFKQAHTTLTETPHAESKLHKLIDADSVEVKRKRASKKFANFLAKMRRNDGSTSNTVSSSSVVATMHGFVNGQATKFSNPVLAPSTVGAVRAYRVSSRTNSLFACDRSFAGALFPIDRSPCVPFAALRSKYPVGHWNSSVVYAAGTVFQKLYRLRLLR